MRHLAGPDINVAAGSQPAEVILTSRQFPRSHPLMTARSFVETPRYDSDSSPEKENVSVNNALPACPEAASLQDLPQIAKGRQSRIYNATTVMTE